MCNCKKNRNQPTPEPTSVPEPPKEEIDHFNNIDTIEPINNG
jgi:hypothetical protein